MRFLIAGSSGFLGTRLSQRLVTQGHEVTALVRRPPGAGEVRWNPQLAPLGPEVVDDHDVVVNLAGSPTFGNPHSGRWQRELMESRVTTTRVLADAIAAGDRRPAFLAGNAIGIYGPHGEQPVTEDTDSVGDALLTRVSRAWQAETEPAVESGARVALLRTAPVYDVRSQPLKLQRLLFLSGLGGPVGDGRQYVPMISTRDWVDAVVHLASHQTASGPFNLTCEQAPTNAEFTRELARRLRRPAIVRAPAVVVQRAAGELANEVLGSVNAKPAALLATGYRFQDPDVGAVLTEALSPSR